MKRGKRKEGVIFWNSIEHQNKKPLPFGRGFSLGD